MPKIVPNLWFDTEAEQAAQLYCSVFPNSRILATTRYPESAPGPTGSVMTVDFELDGQRFTGINGGPQFPFTEAVSFLVSCKDQEEIDYYWERLGDGGKEIQCGWLTDRYGLAWQIVPEGVEEYYADDDPRRADRVMKAMMPMKKLDVAALRAAADGVPAG